MVQIGDLPPIGSDTAERPTAGGCARMSRHDHGRKFPVGRRATAFLYHLLREQLKLVHAKPLAVGYCGTTRGQNFIYAPLNRVIKLHDLNMIHISGPGHGSPALAGNTCPEGSCSPAAQAPDVGYGVFPFAVGHP